jgi:prepilin-type processing-associated H-X9-DG protein
MWPACINRGELSWHVSILPELEQAPLVKQLDFQTPADVGWRLRGITLPVYLCPSDFAPTSRTAGGTSYNSTSYLGNSGTGVALHGFNGLFQDFGRSTNIWPEGPVRVSQVRDGLSNTASVAEVLHATGDFYESSRLRNVWNPPVSYPGTPWPQVTSFCVSIPDAPQSIGITGSPLAHGFDWLHGNIGWSTYNHVLTPQQPSCFNGTDVMTGIYTSQSGHSGVVNVVFADGHVQSISSSVDSGIWTAFGSRSQ